MHADTQPRRANMVAFPEVPWRRACVPVMTGVGHEGGKNELVPKETITR